MGRLRDQLPGLILELIADDTNLSLTRRQADLAVRIGRPRQPGLIARRAGSVITGLYAARSYVARRAPLGDGLAGCDVVDYDDSYQQREEVAWLRQRAHAAHVAHVAHAAHVAHVALRVNHTLGVATALRAGLGVGALPCWLGDATHDLERVLPAASFGLDLWIVIHRDLRHAARVPRSDRSAGRRARRRGPGAARPGATRQAACGDDTLRAGKVTEGSMSRGVSPERSSASLLAAVPMSI